MAIKRYVVNNKRKSTCILVMFMFLIVSLFVVIFTNYTNAGVYVKDDDGEYMQIHEIKILEIVAKTGQQVLGYTVKGQEPITVEKIESYSGNMDIDVEDFKNVTGYELEKTKDSTGKFSYKVKKSNLNTTFNENVLGESMSDGEIVVKAVQANELTSENLEWADLVYINSNDSSDNLLYYYDQFMCDGSMGIVMGDKGPGYNSSLVEPALVKDIALKKISTATGSKDIAGELTDEDFMVAGVEGYAKINLLSYVSKIADMQYGSLSGQDISETRTKVEEMVALVNDEVHEAAYEVISGYAGESKFSDDDVKKIAGALESGLYKGYNPLNIEAYCDEISSYITGLMSNKVETMISEANGKIATQSYENLAKYKEEGYVVSEKDKEEIKKCLKTLNTGNVKDEFIEDYVEMFLSDSFEYTGIVNSEDLTNLINEVNLTKTEEIILELEGCIGNEENTDIFAQTADTKFAALDVDYIEYNLEEYLGALKTSTNANMFKDENGDISIEKVEEFVNNVNNRIEDSENSYDVSWRSAEYLVSLVMNEDIALIYNAELLTSKTLGDYTQDMSNSDTDITNTNNMYKMLLLIRQIRPDFYNELRNKIDDSGKYYAVVNSETNAFEGEGVISWNVNTFINEIATYDSNKNQYVYDYKKCHEPEVVGDTYSENGSKGLNTNYVHGRVYSYTGSQFFAGKNFYGTDNFNSTNTATNEKGIETDNNLTEYVNNQVVGKSKGDIIRYLLDVSLMQLSSPLRVLEVQPAASVSELDSDKAKGTILTYMKLEDTAENRKLIEVDTVSVKELNTRSEDLMSSYDLIYFGVDSGYQVLKNFNYNGKEVKRTTYNDTSMIGLVYTGIGDEYKIEEIARGTAASDYTLGTSSSNGKLADLGDKFTSSILFRDGYYLNVEYEQSGKDVKTWQWETKWDFERQSDGSYIITIHNKNYLALDVKGASSNSGTGVQIYNKDGNDAQRWYIYAIGDSVDDGFYFVPKCATNCVLDVRYNNLGENLQIYNNNGNLGYAQKFYITSASIKSLEDEKYNIADSKVRSEYEYWLNNFTSAFVGNEIDSWNLDVNAKGRWYIKTSDTTTRLLGNDLTVKKMEELIEYAKAGCPIMLAEEIYDCDSDKYIDYDGQRENASKWRYVDVNSKMYNFITTIKKLGYDEEKKEYTGLDAEGNQVFDDGYKYANIVIYNDTCAKNGRNPESLSEDSKFKGGLSYAIKRSTKVNFELVDGPLEYSSGKKAGETGNMIESSDVGYTTYRYELKPTSKDKTLEWIEENYTFEICVDKSGTGRFEEKYIAELEPTITFDKEKGTIILEGKWPGNMDGFVAWRVTAYNKINPNNAYAYTGFSAFAIKDTDKKDIYVLWIDTTDKGSTDKYTEVNSTNNRYKALNLDFAKMISDNAGSINEYNIKVMKISIDDFVKVWNDEDAQTYTRSTSKIKVKTMKDAGGVYNTYSNGKYTSDELADTDLEFHMMVFGYCDSYTFGNGDGLDIDSVAAQDNINYFLDAGHSILYVHDNSSYLTTLNYYTNSYNDVIKEVKTNWWWGRYNTAFLRGRLGMDTFGITYSAECFNPESSEYVEYLANARKYVNADKQEDYRGFVENMVFKYQVDGGANNVKSNYASSLHGTNIKEYSNWQYTNTVDRANQGQITEYPFVIGESLSTATTHCQYTTLNMEDEELTVWYTLGGNGYYNCTSGDGANNYYIYSKGNITYTGAGHSLIDGSTIEGKLFINTVIASIKAGKYDSTLEFIDLEKNANGEYVVYRSEGEDITVKFKPINYDANKGVVGAFSECKIYVDVNNDGVYNEGDKLLYNYDDDAFSKVKDLSGSTIGNTMKGTELINRQDYTFVISGDDVRDYIGEADIYKYPIVVSVTDVGTESNPEDKTTAIGKISVVESKLFNLN